MPHAKSPNSRRPDPRGPLVFGIAALARGSAAAHTRTVPAPAGLGAGMVHVPEGADLELDVLLEEVTEGVLVTASVTAPLAGECARCLARFTSAEQVRFTELFAHQHGSADDEGYLLDGNLLDLEPALRDALVLELPLSPLCAPDCRGLCAQCGIRLADAPDGHGHADAGGAWAVLANFVPARNGTGDAPAGPGPGEQGTATSDGTTRPAGSKER